MPLHRRGNISTEVVFETPNLSLFEAWKSDFFSENPDLPYDVYLVGSLCNNIYGNGSSNANDMDICLMGSISNRKVLKNTLDSAFKIGINHNILVDVAWRNKIITSLTEENEYMEKITTYVDVEDVDDKGVGVVYSMDGIITQMFPGLYYYRNFDFSDALSKARSKGYVVPYKKIN